MPTMRDVLTVRAVVNARRRRFAIIYFSAYAIALISFILAGQLGALVVVGVVAVVVGLVAMSVLYFGIRCPRCGYGLGSALGLRPFRLPKRFRYCPSCGLDFEAAADDAA